MSKFYGQVEGKADTIATRQGSEKSGIKASVQSWDGSVITAMRYNENGELIVKIYIHNDSSFQGEKYFEGTLDELKKRLKGGE